MKHRFKIFKKAIGIITIVSLFSQTALVFKPIQAEAGYASQISGAVSTGVDIGGILGAGLTCVFPQGLTAGVTDLAHSIFDSKETKEAAAKLAEKKVADEAAKKTAEETEQKTIEATAKLTTVPVIDLGTINKISGQEDSQNANLSTIDTKLLGIQTKENQNYKKTHCLDTIAHLITTKVIDRMTLATVDWINNGFEGAPLYLENPGKFFENIAADEINGFTAWFTSDAQGYPFGTLVMGTILTNLQRQFSQNLQFSLNQVLAHGTYEDFKIDFSVGGWAGYTAFLEPQNNPFGNYLLANEELGRRISGTSINVAENFQRQLNQSGGFLNQRKCVMTATGDPGDIYLETNDPLHITPGSPIPDAVYAAVGMNSGNDVPTEAQQDSIQELSQRSQCTEWKTVTPGSVVANQLTTNLNLQTSKLVNADALNEDLGLIFDALLNQLVQKGLNSLQGTDPSTNVALAQVNGENPGSSGVTYPGDSPNQPSGVQPAVSAIITGTGGVDTTLHQIQVNYIQAASQAVPVLENDLIPRIYSLDYCVPGPNPRWVSNALANLQVAIDSVVEPPITNTEAQNEQYYQQAITSLTGVTTALTTSMETQSQFRAFMQNVLDQYAQKMVESYSLNQAPPTVRALLPSFFSNLDVFKADLDSINTYLAHIADVLPILSGVEVALNQIATQNNGVLSDSDPAVQAQLSIFDSISSQLVSQAQLQELNEKIPVYNAKIGVLNTQIDSCLNETINNVYPHPNKRAQYNEIYFNYPGLPAPDNSFLPGVNLGNGSNDIHIDFGGVTVANPSNGLGAFETTIHSVY